ncbi:MAG TPA: FKBP-type peptidyl-prolyl cis-trans isomerase, partial [Longimicrobiales bacterium]|nr:FKBP-type peptidyl-prolyl cis-trans isomerase [Longimicrobiales bacterium]
VSVVRSSHFTALVVCATVTVSACNSGGSGSVTLETDDQVASYGIGRNMGAQLVQVADHLDMDALTRGVRDAVAEVESPVPEDSIRQVLQRFSQTVQQEQQASQQAAAQENLQKGQAFLAENAEKEGVTTTESGLQYEVLDPGEGERPAPGDQVTINYRGTLVDGTEFDSSYKRGEPTTFGVSGVIPGFSEGLQLMPVGSKYKFYIPSDLAYGPRGQGQTIGPNETLIFEVELLSIG